MTGSAAVAAAAIHDVVGRVGHGAVVTSHELAVARGAQALLALGAEVGTAARTWEPTHAAGILTRGLILKCSRCRATAFQPLAAVNDRFACPRCSFSQPLTSKSWCDTPPHEPAWFYRLDELVYQALLENVRVPALALAEIGACSENARHLWSIELVRDGERELELDFLCLVEGKLSAGEAKSNGTLSGRDAKREVRKTLTGARYAQADQVVFATTDPEWSQPMHDVVRDLVSTLDRPRALLLTALA